MKYFLCEKRVFKEGSCLQAQSYQLHERNDQKAKLEKHCDGLEYDFLVVDPIYRITARFKTGRAVICKPIHVHDRGGMRDENENNEDEDEEDEISLFFSLFLSFSSFFFFFFFLSFSGNSFFLPITLFRC